MKKRKNRFYTKDVVYLADFFVNIGVLVLIFLNSHRQSLLFSSLKTFTLHLF